MADRRLLLAAGALLVIGSMGAYALLSRQHSTPAAETNAAQHWQRALEALARDDFVLAKTHLTQCLEVWPINAEVHFVLARVCRRAGDDAGWQDHWRKAEILGWERSSLNLERALRQAQAGNLRGVEDRLLSQLDSSPPEEELILEALAKGYLQADYWDALLELTRKWTQRYPDHWQGWLFRARALQLIRSVDQAIADYGRVLELKPDHAEAHFELAAALLLNSQFADAARHFHIYLQRHPDDPAALVPLANCQLSLGQIDAAAATLRRALAVHHDDAAGFFVQAKLARAEGKAAEAFHWLQRAEALAPHETDITYNLVLVLQQLGKLAEAKVYEQKLQELRRQYQQLDAIKAKIRLQPDDPALRDEAASLLLRLGRHDEAGRWLRSALQLDPDHRPTHRLLAEYFQKLGKPDRAAFHRRKSADR